MGRFGVLGFAGILSGIALGGFFGPESWAKQIPDETSTAAGLNEVRNLERDVKELFSEIEMEGLSTEAFYKDFVNPVDQGKVPTLDLDKWESRHSLLHSLRYSEISKKQHYFILNTHIAVQMLIDEATATPNKYTLEQLKTISSKFKEIQSKFMEWADYSDSVVEGVDPKHQRARMYSFHDYFEKTHELLEFMKLASKVQDFPGPPLSTKIGNGALSGIVGTYVAGQVIFRNMLSALNYLNPFHWFFKESIGNKVSRKLFGNFTPLTTRGGITQFFKSVTKMKGYKVTVEGTDNLKGIPLNGTPGEKVVNLFLPPHRHDIADAMVMSHLGLPHFLIFANPSAFAGNIVFGTLLAALPEFISVGKWRGFWGQTPSEKVIEALENGRSPNVINYAQGFVSNGGEILPINARFVEGLIAELIKKGFKVNVIPISYEVDSSLLSKTRSVDELELIARFHPPLLHHSVEYLVDKQLKTHQRYFDHFLASLWFENIKRFPELSIDELMNRANERLSLSYEMNY